ncbi:MAG TPA: histidine triad nucleotide-binding protein [Rhabdochlamydiaceae bacterium]|nr:histidine triad nucleotide-binding protein [Rhabdochlamydiaceae bacterium]
MTTIFGKIIKGQLPCEKVFENDRILAIKDIAPAAPVHILIMPKKEIPNLQSIQPEDLPLIGEIVQVAQKLAEEFGIGDGYRLLINNGTNAGQTVMHLHFHLLGGKKMSHFGLG